jgi:hypothetical protein
MSPRMLVTVKSECPYVECDQYFSMGRGLMTQTYICKHPENEGCTCEMHSHLKTNCEFFKPEEKIEKTTTG